MEKRKVVQTTVAAEGFVTLILWRRCLAIVRGCDYFMTVWKYILRRFPRPFVFEKLFGRADTVSKQLKLLEFFVDGERVPARLQSYTMDQQISFPSYKS